MADRYWVNRLGGSGSLGSGTGKWNSSDNWSASSGGLGGAGVPTSSDNVVFDTSSAGSCDLDTTPTIIDWTMTSGYSGATLSLGIYTVTCTGNVSIASSANILDAGTSKVDMAGASSQTLGNPTESNAFYNLDISQNTGLTDDVRVWGGALTIDSGYYLNTQLVAGTGYDIYLRGSGTVLYLNGWIRSYGTGNEGVLYFELDEDGAIMNIPGGTGYNTDGTYTACALRMVLVGAISGTFSLQGNIGDVDNMQIYGLTDGGSLTFNTNNYNIELYSFFHFGYDQANEAEITCNFGSSSFTVPQLCRFMSASDATFNMGTSTWDVSIWSVYPGPPFTWNLGTSSIAVSSAVGESWHPAQENPPTPEFYDLAFEGSTVTCYVDIEVTRRMTIAGANSSIRRSMQVGELYARALTANRNVEFTPGFRHQIGGMDISGTGAYRVNLYSATAGTPWSGNVTGYGRVDHTTVRDSEFVGEEIDALDQTNEDRGNNGPSWVFDDNQIVVSIS